jgi:hypothetical protein
MHLFHGHSLKNAKYSGSRFVIAYSLDTLTKVGKIGFITPILTFPL